MKRIIPLLIAMQMIASSSSEGQFTLTTNGNTIAIAGYTGSGGVVVIPDHTNGMPVTDIAYEAFDGAPGLYEIVIPDTVGLIERGAFVYCGDLTNVALGNGLTNIGGAAFAFSGVAGSLSIPDSVRSIDGSAFEYCRALTNVNLGSGITSIQPWAFDTTGLTTLFIPNGVTNIGSMAFDSCFDLTSVTVGSSVTDIGQLAFGACYALTNINLDANLTTIETNAFNDSGLLTVIIPPGVTNISGNAFSYCSGLTNIVVDPLNPAYSSADGVMYDKAEKTIVEYPRGRGGVYTIVAGVTNIGVSAFEGSTYLGAITIPSSVSNIEDAAFYWCTALTNVYFGGNAPRLGGEDSFYDYQATVYYFPGTAGWGSTYDYLPTRLWLPNLEGAAFCANAFSFEVTWASGALATVEACTNLTNPVWAPLTNITFTNSLFYFSDPLRTNYPSRYYRVTYR